VGGASAYERARDIFYAKPNGLRLFFLFLFDLFFLSFCDEG
jgi:hypothetical protein